MVENQRCSLYYAVNCTHDIPVFRTFRQYHSGWPCTGYGFITYGWGRSTGNLFNRSSWDHCHASKLIVLPHWCFCFSCELVYSHSPRDLWEPREPRKNFCTIASIQVINHCDPMWKAHWCLIVDLPYKAGSWNSLNKYYFVWGLSFFAAHRSNTG